MSYYCHGSDFTINYGVICTIFEAGQFQQIVFSFKYNSNPHFKFVKSYTHGYTCIVGC